MPITPIDASQNKYAHDVNYCVVSQKIVILNGRQVQKITYHNDELCLLGKISQLVFTILATIATLGIFLCFTAGRQLWINSINNFKRPVVYQNIPRDLHDPNSLQPDQFPDPTSILAIRAQPSVSSPTPVQKDLVSLTATNQPDPASLKPAANAVSIPVVPAPISSVPTPAQNANLEISKAAWNNIFNLIASRDYRINPLDSRGIKAGSSAPWPVLKKEIEKIDPIHINDFFVEEDPEDKTKTIHATLLHFFLRWYKTDQVQLKLLHFLEETGRIQLEATKMLLSKGAKAKGLIGFKQSEKHGIENIDIHMQVVSISSFSPIISQLLHANPI